MGANKAPPWPTPHPHPGHKYGGESYGFAKIVEVTARGTYTRAGKGSRRDK
jgi:hypothetical protein